MEMRWKEAKPGDAKTDVMFLLVRIFRYNPVFVSCSSVGVSRACVGDTILPDARSTPVPLNSRPMVGGIFRPTGLQPSETHPN